MSRPRRVPRARRLPYLYTLGLIAVVWSITLPWGRVAGQNLRGVEYADALFRLDHLPLVGDIVGLVAVGWYLVPVLAVTGLAVQLRSPRPSPGWPERAISTIGLVVLVALGLFEYHRAVGFGLAGPAVAAGGFGLAAFASWWPTLTRSRRRPPRPVPSMRPSLEHS